MSSGYLLLKLRKAMLLLYSYEPEMKELDFWNISDYPAFFYSITLRFKPVRKELKEDFVFPAKNVVLLRKAFLGNQPLFGKNHATLRRHVMNQSVSLTLAKDLACCLVSTQNMLAVKCQVGKKRSNTLWWLIKTNLECSMLSTEWVQILHLFQYIRSLPWVFPHSKIQIF